jgi:hypothetical protein
MLLCAYVVDVCYMPSAGVDRVSHIFKSLLIYLWVLCGFMQEVA